MSELILGKRILWPRSADGRPREKVFLKDLSSEVTGYSSLVGADIYTRDGSNELRSIFDGQERFTFPKPSEFIRELLFQAVGNEKDAIILDFFAGSGTTAHAVYKINKEDEGSRRVILVSDSEATIEEPAKNLCEDVCAERVRRIVAGYSDIPGLEGDFAYLKCRRVEPSMLLEIDHEQVWIALQLTHVNSISPIDESAPLAVTDTEDVRLIYIPHFLAKHTKQLRQAVKDAPSCIVYTWQPALIRSKIKDAVNMQIEAVPESLARRFGIRM